MTVVICFPGLQPGQPKVVAVMTKDWEASVVDMKDGLTTDALIIDVEERFMTKFGPATMCLICYFMDHLLMGAQQQPLPTRHSQGLLAPI
jgi:hypothetical protein